MVTRPIDIARKLNISTTTLRKYEEFGLIPPVVRSASGYRVFTEEHIAYFICIREMLIGFSLTHIAKILQEVMAKKIASALWMVNKAQADLHQEKIIAEKIVLNLLYKSDTPIHENHKVLTIHDVSRETGVPATTIRYWDKVGLISVERSMENNYRLFTARHIQQILTIYALKFSVSSKSHKYSVEKVKEELQGFDYKDKKRIRMMTNDIQQHLEALNRAQIHGISALYHLCMQVETNHFENQVGQIERKKG